MGTHPIFESDFDCLTECQTELTRKETRTRRPMAVATMCTRTVVAASTPRVAITSTTPHPVVMTAGTTTQTRVNPAAANHTEIPTTAKAAPTNKSTRHEVSLG